MSTNPEMKQCEESQESRSLFKLLQHNSSTRNEDRKKKKERAERSKKGQV